MTYHIIAARMEIQQELFSKFKHSSFLLFLFHVLFFIIYFYNEIITSRYKLGEPRVIYERFCSTIFVCFTTVSCLPLSPTIRKTSTYYESQNHWIPFVSLDQVSIQNGGALISFHKILQYILILLCLLFCAYWYIGYLSCKLFLSVTKLLWLVNMKIAKYLYHMFFHELSIC